MIQFSTGHYGLVDLVGLLVSVVIPILVDLVTKRLADPRFKAITLAALSAVNGFLMELLQAARADQAFQVDQAAMNAVESFIIAVALFYGLWKPAGVSGSTGVVQSKVPGGVGPEAPRVNMPHDRSDRGAAELAVVGYVLALFGLVFLLVGLVTSSVSWVLGLVLLVVGVALILFTKRL